MAQRPNGKSRTPWTFTGSKKLAKQQLWHDLRNRKCPGDQLFRVTMQQPTWQGSQSRSPAWSGSNPLPWLQRQPALSSQTKPKLLMLDSVVISQNQGKSIKRTQKRAHRVCAVCGINCHHICALCKDDKHKDGVPLHKPPAMDRDEKTCTCQCHNTLFHGPPVAKSDA